MVHKNVNRRDFAKSMTMAGVASISFPVLSDMSRSFENASLPEKNEKLNISLNAYSFDKPFVRDRCQ
jgi:hypothetical protein